MKTGYSHIGFIMDRSGSMGVNNMHVEASNAFNQFVAEQREVEGEATFTFVEFDGNYNVIHDFVPLDDVQEYTLSPGGSTALLDAIGTTINTIGAKLDAMPESERPERVIIAIMTDGGENASHEFTSEQIREMIQRQESEYNWVFMFLGANQDSFSVAANLGMSTPGAVMNYVQDSAGIQYASSSLSAGVTTCRASSYTVGDALLPQDENENQE